MAAEIEEAVAAAHPADVQQLLPDRGQPPLEIAGRRLGAPGGGGAGIEEALQGLAVHLAVGRQRQGLQDGQLRRDHVDGQPAGEVEAQRLQIEVAGGRHAGHEAPVAGGEIAHHHGGLADSRAALQGGLDLARLDAEAADLHLVVGAAQELQPAVGEPAGEVAGAVEARAGLGRTGSGTKRSAVRSGRPR